MKAFILLVYIFILASCHSKEYTDESFTIDPDYRNLVAPYRKGDTLVFKSDRGNIEKLLISFIDSSIVREANLMGKRPHKTIDVKCRSVSNPDPGEAKTDGWLLSVLKFPDDNSISFGFTFKTGVDCLDQHLGPLLKDTVFNNGVRITDYYKIEYCWKKSQAATEIQTVYSSIQKGIEVYTTQSGEQWVRVN